MQQEIKRAQAEYPVLNVLEQRWSPYSLADKPVSREDLLAMFEAARWAPSSYNDQPWRYIVALREDQETYQKILSCLVEANQAWAKQAPVLVLGLYRVHLSQTGAVNPAAQHDLGAASMSLCLEATRRGLVVHQMIGILPERAAAEFQLGAESKALTALAIGYIGDVANAPEPYKTRDSSVRTRLPLNDIVQGL